MLNNIDITALIASNDLILNHEPSRIQPASYDLVIGTIFRDKQIINASHARAKDPIEIAPGEVVTMLSLEELKLPNNICATAYAMNGQSSEGLLVLNPGHVDPGFKGPLTIVALNLRKVPIALQLGEPIFTVVFNKLAQSATPPYPNSNASRADIERRANKKVVEKSVASLQQLLLISEVDINRMIRAHWLSWIVLCSTIVAAATGLVAVGFAAVAAYPTSKSDRIPTGMGNISEQSVAQPPVVNSSASKNRP
jgi:deoxycytidine triphosphate deaminase